MSEVLAVLSDDSRIEATALFQELSTGLFAARDLLAQYQQATSGCTSDSVPLAVDEAAGSFCKNSERNARSSEAISGIAPVGMPSPSVGGARRLDTPRISSDEMAASSVAETASTVSSAGSAALDRARRATNKSEVSGAPALPGGGAAAAEQPFSEQLFSDMRDKLRAAEAAAEEARAVMKAERNGRLTAEAMMRDLGANVPEIAASNSSSAGGSLFLSSLSLDDESEGAGCTSSSATAAVFSAAGAGAVGSTSRERVSSAGTARGAAVREKGRSTGHAVSSAFSGALAASSGLFAGLRTPTSKEGAARGGASGASPVE